MDQVLGLVLLALYIAAIVTLAAAITFAVVRIFPTERNPKKPDKPEKSEKAESANGAAGAGSLFRRAKRRES